MRVVVLTSPGCQGCNTLEKMLSDLDVPYREVDVTAHPEYLARHPVMVAPGLVVDGRLVHCGVPTREQLERLLE